MLDENFRKRRASMVRDLAARADPYIKRRLLDLAARYEGPERRPTPVTPSICSWIAGPIPHRKLDPGGCVALSRHQLLRRKLQPMPGLFPDYPAPFVRNVPRDGQDRLHREPNTLVTLMEYEHLFRCNMAPK